MDFLKPRSHRMNRRRRIYEGKAKVLYEGPEPGTLIQHFKDDATAFNAKKHEVIEGKGVLNNRISEYLFQRLNDIGVPTHFIRRINMREQLIREVEIIPLEVVVRNVAAGSLATRLGLEEGAQLPRSIIEFYYKNDQLNDPMVSEEHITAFGWAAPQEIDDIMALAIRVNDFLSGLFLGVGIRLVDFKIECGRLWEGDNMRIVLADEISPDSCRLWDVKTNDKMDKDRFRKDLGGMIEAYTEVARRLGVVQENEVPRAGRPAARAVTAVIPLYRRATIDRAPSRRQARRMARIVFTANLRRHVDCPESEAEGATVREALETVFRATSASRLRARRPVGAPPSHGDRRRRQAAARSCPPERPHFRRQRHLCPAGFVRRIGQR